MKSEVERLVISIFDDPLKLKTFVRQGFLKKLQARSVLRAINGYNALDCACCRRMDIARFRASRIEETLYPILDIAQANLKDKEY